MDWIFQEAYKTVQKLLDGTLTSQQLIPFLTIIILFGALLKRQQIAKFIKDTIERTQDYRELESAKTKFKKRQAEFRRIIRDIEQELTKIEVYKTGFDTKLDQTRVNLASLPTTHPINEQDKAALRREIDELEGFYRSSLKNFQNIEDLLKDIAEVRRGDVLTNNPDQLMNRVKAKRALRKTKKLNQNSSKDDQRV
jgi:hypothetical protein